MKAFCPAFAIAAFLALAPVSHAQLSSDGGPIEITAERGELDDVKRMAKYVGNVDIIQGDARLRAESVTIHYRAREDEAATGGLGGAIGGLDKIIAERNVYYITSKEKVKADHGVYNAESGDITLTGNVKVTNVDGVIVGETLVIQVETGRYVMDGGEGRVRTVIENTNDKIQ